MASVFHVLGPLTFQNVFLNTSITNSLGEKYVLSCSDHSSSHPDKQPSQVFNPVFSIIQDVLKSHCMASSVLLQVDIVCEMDCTVFYGKC